MTKEREPEAVLGRAGDVEPHRVDVRFYPCVAVCSCGWRFRPPPDRGDARQKAWREAGAHREELFMAPRREVAANLSGARSARLVVTP
jgi:hypothetical protein